MKRTIDKYDFTQAFEDMGRGNQFSPAALEVLFDFFDDYERETGKEVELDVIGICCEFTEYENIEQYNSDYGTDHEAMSDIDETTIIAIDDESFIIQAY